MKDQSNFIRLFIFTLDGERNQTFNFHSIILLLKALRDSTSQVALINLWRQKNIYTMRVFKFIVFVCILLCESRSGSASLIGDAIGQISKSSVGILKQIPRSIPTPNEFFELSKNAILGYPSTVVFDLINNFCKYPIHDEISQIACKLCWFCLGSTAIHTQTLSVNPNFTPRVDKIAFILRTQSEDIPIPLTKPDDLWNHSKFNRSLPLVIFITGWKTNLLEGASRAQDTMAAAYLCRGNVNFVVSFHSCHFQLWKHFSK